MKRNIASVSLAVAATCAPSMASEWSEVRDTVIPLQVMMGAMFEDAWRLSMLLGYDNSPFGVTVEASTGNFNYSIAPGTMIGGHAVDLTGTLTRISDTFWSGVTEFSIGRGTSTGLYIVEKVREQGNQVDFRLVGTLSGTPLPPEYLRDWTMDWQDGLGTSQHNPSGATDVIRPKQGGGYQMRVTRRDTASIGGAFYTDLPSTGEFTWVIPAPSTLAILGLALIASRRRR